MNGKPLFPETSARIANMGFLCTLLVVVIHLRHIPHDMSATPLAIHFVFRHLLGSIAVPFFFIVSGFFLGRRIGEPDWWRCALWKRLRTLGIPLLFWCLVPFVLFSVLWTAGEAGGICTRVSMKVSSIAAAFGLNFMTNPEANRPLWYLRNLLVLTAMSPALAWILRKTRGLALAALLVICWTFNPGTLDIPDYWLSLRWQIFWVFGMSVEGLFYFSLGIFLADHPFALTRRRGLALGAVGLAIGFAGLYLRLHDIIGWSFCVNASIPFVMALVWTLTPTSPWNRRLTGNAFAVYVIHAVLIRILFMTDVLSHGSIAALVEWTVIVVWSLVLAILCHRLLPRFSSFIFGGR